MKGILTDVTRCIGCERCVEACTRANKMGLDPPFRTSMGDGLSGRRLTSILKVPGTDRTVRKQCLHCLDPACASACLVGAFKKRPDGPVEYDASMCIGCRYCMLACPYMIPRYEWETPVPYVRKCKMNEDCRVEGGQPACVSACPTGSTIFGPRDKLIEEARRRIEEEPGLYFDHIWGEHEIGGTCVMYISSKDAPVGDVLRFPRDEELQKKALAILKNQGSIPEQNNFWVMLTPFWAASIFTGLWGIWFIRRRQLIMSGELHDHGGHGLPEPGTAGIDEVCPAEPPVEKDDKEGE
jgi:formate dehydrogenase iron-sulfur subunit